MSARTPSRRTPSAQSRIDSIVSFRRGGTKSTRPMITRPVAPSIVISSPSQTSRPPIVTTLRSRLIVRPSTPATHGLPIPRATIRLLEQRGDPPQLVDRRASRYLGRVRGEHRPDADLAQDLPDLLRRDAGVGDASDRPLDPAALLLPCPGQGAAAVDLLGDVRQVEVRRERAHQAGHRRQVEVRQLGEPPLLRVSAHPLDQVQQVLALGTGQGLAQDRRHATDVAAQRPVR